MTYPEGEGKTAPLIHKGFSRAPPSPLSAVRKSSRSSGNSTGGVNAKNLGSYLSLPNVIAAGGSWMVPSDLNEADAFARATAMAREARGLAGA